MSVDNSKSDLTTSQEPKSADPTVEDMLNDGSWEARVAAARKKRDQLKATGEKRKPVLKPKFPELAGGLPAAGIAAHAGDDAPAKLRKPTASAKPIPPKQVAPKAATPVLNGDLPETPELRTPPPDPIADDLSHAVVSPADTTEPSEKATAIIAATALKSAPQPTKSYALSKTAIVAFACSFGIGIGAVIGAGLMWSLGGFEPTPLASQPATSDATPRPLQVVFAPHLNAPAPAGFDGAAFVSVGAYGAPTPGASLGRPAVDLETAPIIQTPGPAPRLLSQATSNLASLSAVPAAFVAPKVTAAPLQLSAPGPALFHQSSAALFASGTPRGFELSPEVDSLAPQLSRAPQADATTPDTSIAALDPLAASPAIDNAFAKIATALPARQRIELFSPGPAVASVAPNLAQPAGPLQLALGFQGLQSTASSHNTLQLASLKNPTPALTDLPVAVIAPQLVKAAFAVSPLDTAPAVSDGNFYVSAWAQNLLQQPAALRSEFSGHDAIFVGVAPVAGYPVFTAVEPITADIAPRVANAGLPGSATLPVATLSAPALLNAAARDGTPAPDLASWRAPTLVEALGLGEATLARVEFVLNAPDTVKPDDVASAAAALQRTGLKLKAQNDVPFKITRPHIRFYNAADAELAQALASRFEVELRDFTRAGTAAGANRIEYWMAGDSTSKPAAQPRTVRKPRASVPRRVDPRAALRQRLAQKLRQGDHL